MSDKITPEERAELIAHVNSGYMTISGEGLKKALKALEQAEDRAEELEEYIAKLVCELTDGKLSKPYDISVITDEVEAIYRAYSEDEIAKATAKAEAENARITKERDWLANKLIDCPSEFTNCAVDCAECRKEAARRAVADAESSEKVPCHACKGKGGAEYEPGLLSYVCNVCGGTGQTERRAVAAGEEPCQK